ncbi:ABC transporter permease [Burkholderia pseudomultivorans]|uniref:Multidrug ABC transporter permease YbhS n=1 Tax=Burkholderia pseudomultivorans TaxID=1207504 RepID=A0ABU2EBW9_9BURK|nr:ABC transporter permease [Burkholderia pseudomultivorans]MDR8730571.1 putative multidrug ABC transporter permease YbhS [Burkholderia pseudomultivorans]MDR8737705.1 putative multidrug ABC transporter permease YbhS [Burkholderia pseudomultivorans]MDR8745224.1 putative multidrug ABC transporter permease YbhS [Burkholderia pseudomultivorans]MDR8757380.1 putative multidrug ABC transporter permease YbhS [Burkholderia pseudomultivorans]MDR8781569.1 putative multidrug ABC transporter permease YbhS 
MSTWARLHGSFSVARWWSIVLKEFLQLRRDRVTFAMIVGVPIIQLALFGFAINTDPKHLPTAVIVADPSPFARSFIAAMRNSAYFDIVETLPDEAAGRDALARGDVLFVLNVPADFSRRLLRGERPSLLVEADATDPVATASALGALAGLVQPVADKDLTGPLAHLNGRPPAFDVELHRLYNPEGITQYNVVPGLMGVILTMTMVMMTGLAITRERERGTMENLLATPVRPIEVMTGKIVPYVFIGLIQVSIILAAARFVFEVPFVGSLFAIYLAALLFIAANLTVGITLSSLAQNQLQAMQLAVFYFLPNILLSGFMFPFAGMPAWARFIGNLLPLTYFNRLVRGILLKGDGWADLWPSVWPVALFTVVVMGIALRFYRRTLD